MELFSIASGSSGNCICVGNDQNHIMIDAGISGKRIEAGMNEMDMTTADCDAILVTHEHSDHIQGLGVLARKYHLPIYGTRGTLEAVAASKSLGKIDPSLYRVIEPEVDFQIGELTVHPIRISHDAADPVAYVIKDAASQKEKRVGVITDLGCYDDHIVEQIRHLDAMLLEANHDVNMLQVGPYPYQLKQRILGNRGHLSNELSGQLLGEILHDNMKHVLLGHLSKENNMEELAYETVSLEITLGDNPYKGTDFPIDIAARDRVSQRIVV